MKSLALPLWALSFCMVACSPSDEPTPTAPDPKIVVEVDPQPLETVILDGVSAEMWRGNGLSVLETDTGVNVDLAAASSMLVFDPTVPVKAGDTYVATLEVSSQTSTPGRTRFVSGCNSQDREIDTAQFKLIEGTQELKHTYTFSGDHNCAQFLVDARNEPLSFSLTDFSLKMTKSEP